MATTGQITLKQGIGSNSGKPYTALQLKVGKWGALHFPTQFEREYLEKWLKSNTGEITLNASDNTLILHCGDYVHNYKVESQFELKYIVNFFRNDDSSSETDRKDEFNLNEEDAVKANAWD